MNMMEDLEMNSHAKDFLFRPQVHHGRYSNMGGLVQAIPPIWGWRCDKYDKEGCTWWN